MRLPSLGFSTVIATVSTLAVPQTAPPVAPVRPVTDVYFGTPVVDPYRWLENPEDPEVQGFMKAQAAYTRGVTKMAARVQAATSSGKPVLLRIDYDAGHGIGSNRSQYEQETADLWSFALWQMGDAGFQPTKHAP